MFLSIGLPRNTEDTHVLALWEKYQLGDSPSTLQIYPVAIKLLSHSDHSQKVDGISIFLGRKIDPEDPLCHLLVEPPEKVLQVVRTLPEFYVKLASIHCHRHENDCGRN